MVITGRMPIKMICTLVLIHLCLTCDESGPFRTRRRSVRRNKKIRVAFADADEHDILLLRVRSARGSRNERAFELMERNSAIVRKLAVLRPARSVRNAASAVSFNILDRAVNISSELKEDYDTIMWLNELDKNLKDKNKQNGQDIIIKCLFKYVDMSKYKVKTRRA